VIGGVPVESGQQIVQVGGGEPPLERLCRGVVAVFEGSEPVPDLGQVGEVVGREDLALHDGEVNLDLVQSRGVQAGALSEIQERCCQDLIASWSSQRRTVEAEIVPAMARATTSRASSAPTKRDSGVPAGS
jgi:hypothetical protein